MIAWVRQLFARFRREPTLEERVDALLDEGDFLAVHNLLKDVPGRGGIGNAYYEHVHRWRTSKARHE